MSGSLKNGIEKTDVIKWHDFGQKIRILARKSANFAVQKGARKLKIDSVGKPVAVASFLRQRWHGETSHNHSNNNNKQTNKQAGHEPSNWCLRGWEALPSYMSITTTVQKSSGKKNGGQIRPHRQFSGQSPGSSLRQKITTGHGTKTDCS